MDFAIEHHIRDAQISVKSGKFRDGFEQQVAMAAAFPAAGPPDARDVASFCAILSDLPSLDLAELRAHLHASPLPSGYRHFRLFNSATGERWNTCFVVEDWCVLTLHNVLFGALNHPTLELSSWTRTEWLPDTIPGVLDLDLVFETRPRTSPMRLRVND